MVHGRDVQLLLWQQLSWGSQLASHGCVAHRIEGSCHELAPCPATGAGDTPKTGIRHLSTDAPLHELTDRTPEVPGTAATAQPVKVTETMVATRLIGPLSKTDSGG
jgi:hypothetical protein